MTSPGWGVIAQTSFARIYWVIATLATAVITARYLGPAGRGLYVAAVAWVTAFSTFGYLSLSQVIVYLAAQKRGDDWMVKVIGSMVYLLSAICITGWLVAAGIFIFSAGKAYADLDLPLLVVTFSALPFLLWIENGNGVLMATGRLHVMNIAQVVGATALVGSTFMALGVAHGGVRTAMAALVLSQAAVASTSFVAVVRRLPELKFDRVAANELLRGGLKLHLNAVGTYLFGQANVLVMSGLRSPRETAFYQLAVQLTTALQIIPLAVSTVSYSLVAKEGVDGAWPKHRTLLLQLLVLVCGAAGIAYFAAPIAVPLLFGSEFTPAVPLFRIMLYATIGMTLSIGMAAQWIGRGLFMQSAFLTLLLGAGTVTANLLLVPRYGAVGAAWVIVAAYSFGIFTNGGLWILIERRRRASRNVPSTVSQ